MNVFTLKTRHIFCALIAFGATHLIQAQETAPVAAAAAAAPDQTRGMLMNIPIFLALFGIFWFGILRPQRQQQKAQSEFNNSIKKGDEVITAGGIIGTVVGITERVITLEVSEGTEIKVIRSQVQGFLKEAMPTATALAKK
jgi:preprotein translocase subunit YajC